MPDTTPDRNCPNCNHPQHLPGTECEGGVDHGPKRWHRCLCLARPGAALPCPPQMNCQGGTLGYADVWYLQHGHTLMSVDGVVSPEALRMAPVPARQVLGTPTTDPAPCRYLHPVDEHSVYGCSDGCPCEWMPKRTPMDPVHILGVEAPTTDGAQQPCTHPEGYEGECPCPPSCPCCDVTAAALQPVPAPAAPLRSDVGTEFVRQADHPDTAALDAIEGELHTAPATAATEEPQP